MNLRLNTWYQDVNDILTNLSQHALIVSIKLVVLRRDNDGIDALRDASITILYGYLTFRVWSEVSHLLTFLADFSQCTHNQVCQVE